MTLVPEADTEIIDILNQALASTLDLQTWVKFFSYSTTGMGSLSLHQLLDQLFLQLQAWDCLISQQIVVLGGTAMISINKIEQNSQIPNYQLRTTAPQGRLLLLTEYMATYTKFIRFSSEVAKEVNDTNTAKQLVQISRSANQFLGLLEAHLPTHSDIS